MDKKFSKFCLSFGIVSLFFSSLSANGPTVVQLTPPKISQATISTKIACTRPMRNGKFNISLDEKLGKTIVHCYGHGGCGWTTLFGSVDKAIGLFLSTNPDKTVPVRVIGSGCMGLTSAIELARLGFKVSGITTKEQINIPSWQAAGYFAFVSVKTSPEEQANANLIGMNTFKVYQTIDQGNHPYITKDAVRFMPVYSSIDTDAGVESLEELGMIPPREYVTLDFGNGVVHPGYVKYMTYFLNTSTLMRQLIAQVNDLNIPIEVKAVSSFGDVAEKAIFNCTGLGSKELNHDADMVPVRGHLIALNQESGSEHMNYMLYTKVVQNGEDKYIYLFPKDSCVMTETPQGLSCLGVLGGTFIPNANDLSEEDLKNLDETEFSLLLERNAQFFYGQPFGG